MVERLNSTEVPLDAFLERLAKTPPVRVPGTAVFMTARPEGAPNAWRATNFFSIPVDRVVEIGIQLEI